MSDLHQLRVTAENQSQIEGVDQKFLAAGLLKARAKTQEVVAEISRRLPLGISEDEARRFAIEVFREHGVTKHWHQPYIRFGEGSVLSFHEPISGNRLQMNDVYHMDVGPVWPASALDMEPGLDYEGDFGDSFVMGKNDEATKLIAATREVFELAKAQWKSEMKTGSEIYAYCKQQAELRGYQFIQDVAGHRLGDFPHHKHTKERMANVAFTPSDSLWILEVMMIEPSLKIGAFYEDLLM